MRVNVHSVARRAARALTPNARYAHFAPSLMLAGVLLAPALSAQSVAPRVTSPKEFFGFNIGDDWKLANYDQFQNYWKKIDAESDRMVVQEIGKTAEGRPQLMAIITSPENFKKLDRYKEIARRLALAEGLSEEDAKALAREGKAVVWFDGGLHATEVLGAHQLIETTYQLISRNDPETTRFLNDLIILAVHANPDGMQLVSNWYMKDADTLKRNMQIPRLYQKYIGHDNNRDFYILNQPESVNIARIQYHEWFPHIVYNHHQTGPAGTVMFAPPFRDPFNYNFDPLIPIGIDMVGAAMHERFLRENKPGITSRTGSSYSTWWNGGLRTTVYFHNMIGLLTETIGNPTPMEIPLITRNQLPRGDLPYPVAPQKWHFRQSVDYSVTANYAVFDIASKRKEDFLYNIYKMGKNSIERGNRDTWTVTPTEIDSLDARIARERQSANASRQTPGTQGGAQGAINPFGGAAPSKYFAEYLRDPAKRDARGYILPSNQPEEGERHGSSRDGAVHRRRQELSGRLVGGEDGAAVPPARARHVRAAGSPERLRVSRRTAEAALRQRGLHARVPDGRAVRSHPRRVRVSVRGDQGPRNATCGHRRERERSCRLPRVACHERRVRRREPRAQGRQ
jgi:hypothetical protein